MYILHHFAMKVRIIDLQEGDIIYDFGELLLVDNISIIYNCARCTSLRDKRFTVVCDKIVDLRYRQLSLF